LPDDEQKRSREELEREVARYRAVYEVMRALGGTLDLDELLDLIITRITEVMEADRSSLFLIDWESEELWSKVAQGVRFMEIRFPMDLGLAGAVATSGEILNIPAAYDDQRFNQDFDRQTGYRTKSVLCVPMTNKEGERIGVIQVLNKKSDEAFDDEDEELLSALAGQAAVAVENSRLYEDQKKSFISFVETLSTAMDARDPITAGHSSRVTLYSLAIGEMLGYSEKQLEVLNAAALLHDIGKIGVPEVILFKDGKLNDAEYKIIQTHARHSLNILEKIHFVRAQKDIPMMSATHHERLDGSGYPLGLIGDDIPEAGRVIAVSDIFDAITSRRHYRDRMEFIKVLRILDEESRKNQIQPEFVNAFKKLSLARIVKILEEDNTELVPGEDMVLFAAVTLGEFQQLIENIENEEGDLSADERDLVERFKCAYDRCHEGSRTDGD
jgi:HD-GYP domain-containing protein (c-di-GMP phosphodiesterase class II)